MAKSVAIILLVLASMALPVWGQAPESFSFTSPLVGWAFFDLSGLNSSLQAQGYPVLAQTLFIWGARNNLLFFRGALKGWDLGFSYWSGNTVARHGERLVRLMVVWSGLLAERSVLGSSAPYELSIGLAGGIGGVSLSVSDRRAQDFEDALHTPSMVFMSRWFFTVQPQLSLRVRVIAFFSVKLSLGYMLTFDSGAWDQEGRALKGPPRTFNGWIVQLSL